MKLELKHLAPYLPYGLKVTNGNEVVEIVVENLRMALLNSDEFKLILHPLSSLTKEIEHDGERFVPIETKPLSLYYRNGSFYVGDDYGAHEVSAKHGDLPYCIFEKLIEWHFDVFGLIDAGIAIERE